METAVRNVRSVVDRDEAEMNGVVQAAGNVRSGAEHVQYHGHAPEQLYEYMAKLSNSFNIIRSDVFYVSASRLFPFFLRLISAHSAGIWENDNEVREVMEYICHSSELGYVMVLTQCAAHSCGSPQAAIGMNLATSSGMCVVTHAYTSHQDSL